jgi:hypothetical protein
VVSIWLLGDSASMLIFCLKPKILLEKYVFRCICGYLFGEGLFVQSSFALIRISTSDRNRTT